MILKPVLIEALASEMFEVFQTHHPKREAKIDPSSLSLADAYEAQARMLALRVQNGERIVGWKVGCTSRAIRQQFGLSHPISGRLWSPIFIRMALLWRLLTISSAQLSRKWLFAWARILEDM